MVLRHPTPTPGAGFWVSLRSRGGGGTPEERTVCLLGCSVPAAAPTAAGSPQASASSEGRRALRCTRAKSKPATPARGPADTGPGVGVPRGGEQSGGALRARGRPCREMSRTSKLTAAGSVGGGGMRSQTTNMPGAVQSAT